MHRRAGSLYGRRRRPATSPWPATGAKLRPRRSIPTVRSTSSNTSTTAGTATAGAGSPTRRARAGCRSNCRKTATIDRVVWGRDREEKFRDRLAMSYRVEVAVEPGSGRWSPPPPTAHPTRARRPRQRTCPPTAWQSAAALLQSGSGTCANDWPRWNRRMKVYAGTFTQPGPTHVLERGDPTPKGEPVAPLRPGSAATAPGARPTSARRRRRLALARWIGRPGEPAAGPRHGQPRLALPLRPGHRRHAQRLRLQRRPAFAPRTARLAGAASSWPTAGSLKPLHRLIVLSSTYRQSSRADGRPGGRPARTGCSGG